MPCSLDIPSESSEILQPVAAYPILMDAPLFDLPGLAESNAKARSARWQSEIHDE
jgi:hypothetical protein